MRPIARLARVLLPVVVLAAMWVVEIVDQWVFGGSLDAWGIRPRSTVGLAGIAFAPFLHGGYAHLAANSIPFLVLGGLVMLRGVGAFVEVSAAVALLGGLGVWVLGPERTVHIGASGLIFGYFGFLLLHGVLERSPGAVAVAIAVACLYGGLVWGVLPGDARVSWQAHLSGFLAGGGFAWIVAEYGERRGRRRTRRRRRSR